MKNSTFIFLIIFSLFLNCSNEQLDNKATSNFNLIEKSNLPDLKSLVTLEKYESQKVIEKKIDSVIKNWKDRLQIVIEDKGLVEINNQGLLLVDYEKIINNKSIVKETLDNPITQNSYYPIYNEISEDDINKFILKQPFKKSENLKTEKANLKKILNFKLQDLSLKEIQVVRLKWKYYDNIFFTNAIFSDNKLIFDEVLSNLRKITYNYTRDTNNFKKLSSSKFTPCDSIPPTNTYISYFDELYASKNGMWGSGAYASVSITIHGDLDITTCTKYINYHSSNVHGYSSYGYSYDAKVGIIDWMPAGMESHGYVNYELAVALAGFSYGNTQVSLTWSSSGFSLSFGGVPGSILDKKSQYVTPEQLK